MTVSPYAGIIGVAILLGLLTVGVPIGVALGLVGLGGLTALLGVEPALIKAGVICFDTLSRYELGVLPLFLLMAHLCFAANASRDFFAAAASLIGHRRGGLALASVGACAGFGAISGSSLATAATVGLVAIPEMRERGYSTALATGAVAAGGTLGQAIPPSGALIVFGIIAEQSIGSLFVAAIVPATTQMLLYFLVIVILCRLRPAIAPPTPRASWAERRIAITRVLDFALLILLVIGGIAFGWFTPPEAASVGVVGALALCAWRGRLTWNALGNALTETLRTSGMIYLIVIGALIFSVFVSLAGMAAQISQLLTAVSGSHTVTLLVMAAVLLLLGSILDGLALMLLTTPILLPVIQGLGLSPIWFGIFLVRAMEIGFVHPPIGMNLYVIHQIAKDVPLGRIFKGVIPFLAADFVHLLLLILVPGLVLALPQALRL
jgi:tripartite ATP-independent transporter DctM subunit